MKNENKNVTLPLFGIPKLIPYLKPYRSRMIRMVLLALVCSIIDVSYPLFGRCWTTLWQTERWRDFLCS